MSAIQDFSKRNDDLVDQCERCHNHFNCLNIHNEKQYCDNCLRIVKKEAAEE